MQDAATAAHGSPIDDLVLGGGTKPVWATRPDGVKTRDLFASLRPGRKAADHSTREGYGPDLSQMEPIDQLDASNRGLPESRVRRLLNGNPPSDIFGFPRKSFASCHFSDRTILAGVGSGGAVWRVAGTIGVTFRRLRSALPRATNKDVGKPDECSSLGDQVESDAVESLPAPFTIGRSRATSRV